MNPILEKTKAAILQKVDQRLVPAIKKTVAAGEKVMYSDQTRQMFIDQLKQGADPETIGAGVAKLVGILRNQSKGTLPMEILVPAATILMCEGLQFMEDAGAVKVDAAFLAECTKAMSSSLLQLFKVSPEQIQGFVDKAKGSQPAQPQPGIVAGAQQGGM